MTARTLAFAAAAAAVLAQMPLPFTRVLQVATPPMSGEDVTILQNLLQRRSPFPLTNVFDAATASAVSGFQGNVSLPATGVLDAPTASAVLSVLSSDGYRDNGKTPASMGYLYKVFLPVHRNRSIETTASLIAGNGSVLFTFVARAHGSDFLPSPPWPHWNNSGYGLNVSGAASTPRAWGGGKRRQGRAEEG